MIFKMKHVLEGEVNGDVPASFIICYAKLDQILL